MITFAIIRHAEYKVPKDPAEFAKVWWIVEHPPLTAKGKRHGIRMARKLQSYILQYIKSYIIHRPVFGPVYHAQTLRCIEMANILVGHGPFKKAVSEPGLFDTPQAWSPKAVRQEVAGARNLNHDWWIGTKGLEDPDAHIKTELPKKAFQRVKRAMERIISSNKKQVTSNNIIGLVLPSVIIQMVLAHLLGIDPAITTRKFPFDKGSVTLITEEGKLLVSNAKL